MSIEGQPSKLSMLMVNRGDSVEKIVRTDADAAETLEVYEQVVLIDTETNAGTFTLTLPPVTEAAGKHYSITLAADDGNVTIQDQDDSYNWEGDYTLSDANDCYLLFSDGLKWWNVSSYGI